MLFLDPTIDIAFKKLFGTTANKNILINFLNSILGRSGDNAIVDVTFNDPNNIAETPALKGSIVDVRCTDQRNNQYIIEMQVITQNDYAARAQYYSSLALSRQLASGQKYDKLVPVIFVGVLNFSLFNGEHYLSHHLILDSETYIHELKHLEFHFIELKKFNKSIEELSTIQDKWIYFLKNAGFLESVPPTLKAPAIKDAFDVLAQSNWTKTELEAYDRYQDAIRSSQSQMDTALALGEREGKMKIAKKLLNTMDTVTIAQLTELPIEEIEKLKNGSKKQ